jgi:hypothetical protein
VHGLAVLIADLAAERDDALVAFAGAALVGHRRHHLDGVAVLDRLVDPPGVDAHHGDDGAVVDARLAHEPAGDGEHERPVRDRLAVGLLSAELPVDVRRIEVAGQAGELTMSACVTVRRGVR